MLLNLPEVHYRNLLCQSVLKGAPTRQNRKGQQLKVDQVISALFIIDPALSVRWSYKPLHLKTLASGSGAGGQWDSRTIGQWGRGTVGQWGSGTVGQ